MLIKMTMRVNNLKYQGQGRSQECGTAVVPTLLVELQNFTAILGDNLSVCYRKTKYTSTT